ncbi:EAL domain-containing protein [Evansella sp. AB-P1]|uniref:EAL domain-containing protein n=1 Tax=Evansella sp. AB-P1 TaxID=3037653 RepID=UPI00241FC7B5|nr:EAL domain-containing protein [Evansella sp. AB-P1]MDG5786736.1 EAL domain-containing protein [Evansella sp. AB-P1]
MSIDNFIKKEQFYHFYQPIYDITTMNILGYEALLRSSIHKNPMDAFQLAINEKKLYELDMRSIHKALFSYGNVGSAKSNRKLFLNVFPSTILNQKFFPFLTKIMSLSTIKSQQIIFEISESELPENFHDLRYCINKLTELGFDVAIDDFGKGFANFEALTKIDSAFIKLDRFFTSDLHQTPKKQSLLKHLMDYSKEFHTPIILEGIENELTKEAALDLGVIYAQGFGLSKPLSLSEVI